MVYASLGDVQEAYEQAIPADLTVFVQKRLDYANAKLAQLIPSLAGRIAAGTVPALLAQEVVVDAVLRVLRNPAGVKGEHAGEYGYYLDAGNASGRVTFLPEELAPLQPSGRRARLRSVGLADDALEYPTRRGLWKTDERLIQDPLDGSILYNHAQQD